MIIMGAFGNSYKGALSASDVTLILGSTSVACALGLLSTPSESLKAATKTQHNQ